MVNIGDLPSDILLDLLSRVPGRDLVCNCRLVCLQWRDLVDLATLWKRKCLQEGFNPEPPDRSVPDWKTFYFLCIMKRNLIQNPCGEEGFNFWELESDGGDKWRIEELPGARRRDFPHQPVPKYFVTSQGPCTKHQIISLKNEGYWDELMDKTKPDIVVPLWLPLPVSTSSEAAFIRIQSPPRISPQRRDCGAVLGQRMARGLVYFSQLPFWGSSLAVETRRPGLVRRANNQQQHHHRPGKRGVTRIAFQKEPQKTCLGSAWFF
ncbi:F-box only protein 44-like isoform X1 [Eublepharis macularius]|uniref:F-box only protein 44-like isoform X1 n=1 Tax=Eublepharis macularius TaxID=481883 RepID=A0AA97LJ12_EUBMA|nr:F-box only protein 44-like isoform X1 [Eublepharis macularius]